MTREDRRRVLRAYGLDALALAHVDTWPFWEGRRAFMPDFPRDDLAALRLFERLARRTEGAWILAPGFSGDPLWVYGDKGNGVGEGETLGAALLDALEREEVD